jgi:hypothetical protein
MSSTVVSLRGSIGWVQLVETSGSRGRHSGRPIEGLGTVTCVGGPRSKAILGGARCGVGDRGSFPPPPSRTGHSGVTGTPHRTALDGPWPAEGGISFVWEHYPAGRLQWRLDVSMMNNWR